jgi:hypothetical protein
MQVIYLKKFKAAKQLRRKNLELELAIRIYGISNVARHSTDHCRSVCKKYFLVYFDSLMQIEC